MPCSPNQNITWPDIKEIADRIDALADKLDISGYEKLVDVDDMPFKFDDKEDFSGAINFYVSNPGATVTDQYLCKGLTNTNEYDLDDVLMKMGENEDLYLVHEEDECWCTTIFRVNTTSGKPVLEEVDDQLGCCQSLFVPQIGDALDSSQHIVPGPKAQHFSENGNPGGQLWHIRQRCRKAGPNCGFKFQGSQREDPLESVTGELGGYLTWPIRTAYMAKMVEKLEYILECDNSGGAEEDKLRRKPNEDCDEKAPQYIPPGCKVTICDLVIHCIESDTGCTQTPGCIREDCIRQNGDPTSNEVPVWPWDETTCGGQQCPDGPRFYCQSLQDFEAILDAAEQGLRKRQEPDKVCRERCYVGFELECEGKNAGANDCFPAVGNNETLRGYEEVRHFCDEDGRVICTEVDVYTYIDMRLRHCFGVVTDENPVCKQVATYDDGCEDNDDVALPCGIFVIPIFGGPPQWQLVEDAADGQLNLCNTGPISCAAYSTTYFDDARLGLPGVADIGGTTQKLERWRVKSGTGYTCNGGAPSLKAKVKTTVIENDEVVSESTEEITCNWNSSEGAWISAWQHGIQTPPWPSPRPGYSGTHLSIDCGAELPENCKHNAPTI